MAKKDLGNIEQDNKNLSGVSALFSPETDAVKTAKGKKENFLEEEETTTYPLRLKKSSLKALKMLGVERGVTVKELILNSIYKEYNI
uniref:hypothetical protein n=1 Tax=Pedobacter sp. TaxID=1411316 RepID=UPI0015978891|nr:hypothetical protein [Pedobacter sp.]QJS06228.1 hypothetical protein [Pedobacter sp.]